MVNILFINDDSLLTNPNIVRKLLDPACGTGGMLAESQNYLREHNLSARLYVYGQDYNKRAFATAASDMLMKHVDQKGETNNIRFGDIFTEDQFKEDPKTFDYLLANPPFGVDWKRQQKEIQEQHDKLGYDGRFGAGLPRISDGSLLFLQHMISKFEPVLPEQQKYGSRLAMFLVVLLFLLVVRDLGKVASENGLLKKTGLRQSLLYRSRCFITPVLVHISGLLPTVRSHIAKIRSS